MMTEMHIAKLCNTACNDKGVCYVGLSDNGAHYVCTWKTGEEEFGYSSVSIQGNEVKLYNDKKVRSFTELCSVVIHGILEETRKTIKGGIYGNDN